MVHKLYIFSSRNAAGARRDRDICFPWILQSTKMYRQILHLPKVIENSRNNTNICNIKRVSDPVRKTESGVPGVEIKYRGLKLTSLLNLYEDKQPLPDLI